MRNTLIFTGNSCPILTGQICQNLGMSPAKAELTQFSNGEISVRILTSVREKDVFVVQSGSPKINDSIMELLVMISACKGGSASKISAVLPYFPYSRQSKKKTHRGAITARMLANLLEVAGVKHVITVDLHASQMQGFFNCPVDNLHAEPMIAKWIRRNVPNWQEAVVVSKNAGGTKRVTSLADALKLNFGMVTTDKKRGTALTDSTIFDRADTSPIIPGYPTVDNVQQGIMGSVFPPDVHASRTFQEPTNQNHGDAPHYSENQFPAGSALTENPPRQTHRQSLVGDQQGFDDRRVQEVAYGRLIKGHVVEDDFASPAPSAYEHGLDDRHINESLASFLTPEGHCLGEGCGTVAASSDEEDNVLQNPKAEHRITLVGDVKNRLVFIVDDMIDKPGSWIAAAEAVVKRGFASKVFCIATHGVFGGDSLEQLQACECINSILVTNSFPISQEKALKTDKLVILDLSSLLAEAIRRNHYGESISPLFLHTGD